MVPNQAPTPKASRKRRQRRPQVSPPFSTARPQKAAAAAYSSGQHTGEPRIFRSGVNTCRIVHRELISSVSGSVDFTVQNAFALNPGLAASFPWLSNESAGWERYRFNKLRYCYYTRTGSNVPGSLLMTPDYDASDAAPVSEAIASSYDDCEEDAPWKDICCVLPQRSLMGDMKEKYIRSGPLSANQDIKTYDAGNLFVCTTDGTVVGWGKVWVEYDVTLFNPQVPAGGFQGSGTLVTAGGTSVTNPFGTSSNKTGPVAMTAAAAVLSLSNVQQGQEVSLASNVLGTALTAASFGTPVGCTIKTTMAASCINAAATQAAAAVTLIITAVPASITLTVAGTPTGNFTVASVLAPNPSF